MLRFLLLLYLTAGLAACRPAPVPGSPDHVASVTSQVTDHRLRQADRHTGDWMTYGLNYAETRFSPLDQITADNVGALRLAWSVDLGTKRGLEATPIVVDGILFTTGPWSVVYAFDARDGMRLWTFDPNVPRRYAQIVCCDVVNRGVAVYEGKVFVGTLDGRLIAIDAANGSTIWEVVTVDQSKPYSITGAPRIVRGKVVIGNGGADFGVRGYVSAYDADDGRLVWRTYTVPGNPADGFESDALETAASTWSGEWWTHGGGGTAWDAMAFDPELDLLFIGTGNGSPLNRRHRSPSGGDNLYLASILALDQATGRLVWHYQTTPGETWDYTATQHLILADMRIAGTVRKVIMQAPKNGFFYVLDRVTGELLSADSFVEVTWADSVDHSTGRPVEREGSDFAGRFARVSPGSEGAHNWQPMAFSPQTGLVYIPVQYQTQLFFDVSEPSYEDGKPKVGFAASAYVGGVAGALTAWDPIERREVWRVDHQHMWNGGILSTAGRLVFQGTADGRLCAYDAATGAPLWESPMGTGVVAPPVTYAIDGVQYVTIVAGWGGAHALHGGPTAAEAGVRSVGRIFTFSLDGEAEYPDVDLPAKVPYGNNFADDVASADLDEGKTLYHLHCAACHGAIAVSGGVAPDLRYSVPAIYERFEEIVRGGLLSANGMPDFSGVLDSLAVRQIRAYVISRSIEALPSS